MFSPRPLVTRPRQDAALPAALEVAPSPKEPTGKVGATPAINKGADPV